MAKHCQKKSLALVPYVQQFGKITAQIEKPESLLSTEPYSLTGDIKTKKGIGKALVL